MYYLQSSQALLSHDCHFKKKHLFSVTTPGVNTSEKSGHLFLVMSLKRRKLENVGASPLGYPNGRGDI